MHVISVKDWFISPFSYFQSKVRELVLVGTDELNLLGRHLFFGILLHNAMAHASWVPANKLIIIIKFAILSGRLQKLLFLSALFIWDLWFVLSFNLTIVEGVPIDISEEGMLFHFLSVAVWAQTRWRISVQKLYNKMSYNMKKKGISVTNNARKLILLMKRVKKQVSNE